MGRLSKVRRMTLTRLDKFDRCVILILVSSNLMLEIAVNIYICSKPGEPHTPPL